MIENLSIAVHAYASCILMSFSVDKMLWNKRQVALASVNADKIEYICFNQKRDISTLNGGSLKLVNNFAYLGSNKAVVVLFNP